jgi:hypothetical protein
MNTATRRVQLIRPRLPRRLARRCVVSVVVSSCAIVASVGMGGAGARGAVHTRLSLNRVIQTSPFVGSAMTASDNEDIVYVRPDDAFWIADDNADAIDEVDRRTGALLAQIPQSSFMTATQLNVGALAPQARTEDLEALAYDVTADVLYAFSGSTNGSPTVYRLTRDASHHFGVESWQPLPSEWTGAAWRPADRLLYVANGAVFSTFDYATDTFGPSFSIPDLAKVTGITFDPSNGDLIAVNQRLYRIAMDAHTIRSGWKALGLKDLGIEDSRGVALVDQQIFISDGSDTGTPGDANDHAIFVIDATSRSGHTRHATNSPAKASSRNAPIEPARPEPVNTPTALGGPAPYGPHHASSPSPNRPAEAVPHGPGAVPEHPGPEKTHGSQDSGHGQTSRGDETPRAGPVRNSLPHHPEPGARTDEEAERSPRRIGQSDH